MLPLLGAAIPSLVAGIGNLIGGERQNAANAQQVQKQMDFQERMSSTSYQRATEDMKMAGINPMLAYMQGGASSPQGGAASMENTVGPAISSAMHAARMKADLKLVNQQRAKAAAETENIAWENEFLGMGGPPGEADKLWGRVPGFQPGSGHSVARNTLEGQRRMSAYNLQLAQINSAQAQAQLHGSTTDLNRAGLPAAQYEGTKEAAFRRELYQGVGTATNAIKAFKGFNEPTPRTRRPNR